MLKLIVVDILLNFDLSFIIMLVLNYCCFKIFEKKKKMLIYIIVYYFDGIVFN